MPQYESDLLKNIIIISLGMEVVGLPDVQEYRNPFPRDDNGNYPVVEQCKANLARASKRFGDGDLEGIAWLQKNKFVTIEDVNGSKMISVNYPEIMQRLRFLSDR